MPTKDKEKKRKYRANYFQKHRRRLLLEMRIRYHRKRREQLNKLGEK